MPHKDDNVEFIPSRYPPFPDGLKTTHLETISLAKIQIGDGAEQDRMFEACKTWGFFYLHLLDSDQGRMLYEGSENIARASEHVFALPLEEKAKYPPHKNDTFGYKAIGESRVDKNKKADTVEFFNISKDDMTVPDSEMKREWPKEVLDNKPLLATYIRTAHSVGLQILDVLGTKLGIDDLEEIHQRHKIGETSADVVRMTRGLPRARQLETDDDDKAEIITTGAHTDFGTVTILRNWLGGLQLYAVPNRIAGNLDFGDESGEWMFVEPQQDCAIVNLGDAAVRMSNGVLCSGRHRVITAPGEQGKLPRYSVVYFVRPNNECRVKALRGSGVPNMADDENDEDCIRGSRDNDKN
ncbi:Clavaminate synthase-like protein [Periconia macrospinosa]|uniref:Clavaminate synthase-like protein n=1 Tax=Periconia macrospinosa TaxID=97972 RepID=A0A2V1DFQ9_9PLEO|nr:Clavaminate synthase-like protein [Periconia macrospinosa]